MRVKWPHALHMYYLLLFLKNFLNFFLLSNHGKFVSLLEWKWSRDRTFMIESRLERYARMGDSMTLYHLRDLGGTFIKKKLCKKNSIQMGPNPVTNIQIWKKKNIPQLKNTI